MNWILMPSEIYLYLQSFFREISLSFIIFNYFRSNTIFMVWKMAIHFNFNAKTHKILKSLVLQPFFIFMYLFAYAHIFLLEILKTGKGNKMRCKFVIINFYPLLYWFDSQVLFISNIKEKKFGSIQSGADNLEQ